MNFDLVLSNIKKHITLTSSEERYFCSQITCFEITKNESVLQQGSLCNNIYFVVSGTLSAFYRTAEGKESTVMFATKDWWITDMNSFTNETPAMLDIEAVEDSSLIAISNVKLKLLFSEVPSFEKYFRILFANAYVREQLRALDYITFTTEERYTRFVDKYPQIVQKVSQKQIASYLGVTPEFLSTIKKKNKRLKLS
jgi:CRP-like cAMP-binding protein